MKKRTENSYNNKQKKTWECFLPASAQGKIFPFDFYFAFALFSALPRYWITSYRKQWLRQNKPQIPVVAGRSCSMSAGLRTGSGVNSVAVFAPGISFSTRQRGCDLVPQLGCRGLLSSQPCWHWASVAVWDECPSASLRPRQGSAGWQVDKAPPRPGNVLPFPCPVTPMQCLVCGTPKTPSSG